ncbi:unnamed protein product, partial [Prorocentrum cordatum]
GPGGPAALAAGPASRGGRRPSRVGRGFFFANPFDEGTKRDDLVCNLWQEKFLPKGRSGETFTVVEFEPVKGESIPFLRPERNNGLDWYLQRYIGVCRSEPERENRAYIAANAKGTGFITSDFLLWRKIDKTTKLAGEGTDIVMFCEGLRANAELFVTRGVLWELVEQLARSRTGSGCLEGTGSGGSTKMETLQSVAVAGQWQAGNGSLKMRDPACSSSKVSGSPTGTGQAGAKRGGDVQEIWLEQRWQLMVAATLLWKLDSYTDIAFMFVARDCGSSLWWASLATCGFVVIFGQLFLSTSCSCRDCERELPPSFGFVLLDFKLVNHAVKQVLPFDPDASDLPVARPVTLRTVAHLLSLLKIMGDIAQVSIQLIYYKNAEAPHAFVVLSILANVLHGTLACGTLGQEWLQDELATQSSGLQTGTALRPMSPLPSTLLMRDDVLQVQLQGASVKGRGQAASGAARQASLHGATDPAPRNGAAGSRRRRSPSPPAEMSLLEDQDGEPMADLLL